MLIDLTLTVDAALDRYATSMDHAREGHVGTHFDVMDKEFPIESFKTNGKLVDISGLRDREIEVGDLEDHGIGAGDTVVFYTGYLEELGYENAAYWRRSAELSDAAVAYLIDRKIRLIAVDAAGAQKPKKHHDVDQLCADNGVFIIENVDNLKSLVDQKCPQFTIFTAPLKRTGLSGLPCRVLAEV